MRRRRPRPAAPTRPRSVSRRRLASSDAVLAELPPTASTWMRSRRSAPAPPGSTPPSRRPGSPPCSTEAAARGGGPGRARHRAVARRCRHTDRDRCDRRHRFRRPGVAGPTVARPAPAAGATCWATRAAGTGIARAAVRHALGRADAGAGTRPAVHAPRRRVRGGAARPAARPVLRLTERRYWAGGPVRSASWPRPATRRRTASSAGAAGALAALVDARLAAARPSPVRVILGGGAAGPSTARPRVAVADRLAGIGRHRPATLGRGAGRSAPSASPKPRTASAVRPDNPRPSKEKHRP